MGQFEVQTKVNQRSQEEKFVFIYLFLFLMCGANMKPEMFFFLKTKGKNLTLKQAVHQISFNNTQ